MTVVDEGDPIFRVTRGASDFVTFGVGYIDIDADTVIFGAGPGDGTGPGFVFTGWAVSGLDFGGLVTGIELLGSTENFFPSLDNIELTADDFRINYLAEPEGPGIGFGQASFRFLTQGREPQEPPVTGVPAPAPAELLAAGMAPARALSTAIGSHFLRSAETRGPGLPDAGSHAPRWRAPSSKLLSTA